MRTTRRRALALLGLAAAAPRAVASAAAATAPESRLDPADAVAVRRAYRRLRFSTTTEPFYWWLRGTRYGVVDNRPLPLFEMHVGSFMRCRDLADGGFAVTSLEVVFNTSFDDGRLVERWRNPFTDEELELRVVPVGPTTVEYAADGTRATPTLPGSRIETSSLVRPPVVVDDDLWLHVEERATVTPAEGGGRPFRVADLQTYRGRLSQVLDPAVRFADCDCSYNDVTDWPRWMKMGERPGTRFARCSGRKTPRYEGLPSRYRELLAERFPKIAADPAAALDLPPFRFER